MKHAKLMEKFLEKRYLKEHIKNKHSNKDIPCANYCKTFKSKKTFLSFPFLPKAQKEQYSFNW